MNNLRFIDSITDFFRSPKWLTNLLLGGVCFLIPVVGPMVLMGWLATIFHGRVRRESGESDNWRLAPAEWPVFDFGRFVVYLQRGVWPFLVALVGGLVTVPVIMLCLLPVFVMLVSAHNGHPSDAVVIMAVLFSVGLVILVGMILNVLLAPFVLRAYVLQDFKAAFSFAWARDYLARMWKELVLVVLFTTVCGLVLTLGGYLMLIVGVYFTIGLAVFSSIHLQRQMLDLYVQRGGQPLIAAPSLLDQPPSAPLTWSPPLPPAA